MKITRKQLRRLINEAINEHRIKPAPTNIPPQHLDKIHNLIDMGELEQAHSLIDAFGGPSDYVNDYVEYEEVGDMEKLGNEVADLFKPMNQGSIDLRIPTQKGFPSREFKPGFDYDDMHALDDKATALARDKREKARGSGMSGFEAEDAYDTHIERYFGNRNRPVRGDEFLHEHRIKPEATNIPPQHLDKIHGLIDTGDLEQAQSFIDAFGGDPDYVDDYIEYQEVGNLEKLGNEAAAILSEPGYRHDDVQAVDDRARVIARKSMEGFDDQNDRLEAFYHSYYDRYAKNRNKVNLNNPYHASYDPKVFLESLGDLPYD